MEDAGDGRVKVFARVRPPRPCEQDAADLVAPAVVLLEAARTIRVRSDCSDAALERILAAGNRGGAGDAAAGGGGGGGGEPRDFVFDGVFAADASQKDVYLEAGLPVLREFLRGVNGTIFAYGQTGSGKTHTLLHQGKAAEDAGLLARLVVGLFSHLSRDAASVCEVEAAAMQVYNEQVDDLLHPAHESGGGHTLVVRDGGALPGLTWIPCSQPEEMLDAFARARANVIYAETRMNKASSRSHAIFQLRLTRRARGIVAPSGQGVQRVECTRSKLSVVDLAGSERVKKSGVEGVQFKEATAINRSLLALGNVVSALAARKSHVPMRDSKLTRILDGSIGGNCRTTLVVCASPCAEHVQETLSSLDFATRAMRVEVSAKVNTCVVEVDTGALLADLRGEAVGTVPLSPAVAAIRRASEAVVEQARRDAECHAAELAEIRGTIAAAEEKSREYSAQAEESGERCRELQRAAESREVALRDAIAAEAARAAQLLEAREAVAAANDRTHRAEEKLAAEMVAAKADAESWQLRAQEAQAAFHSVVAQRDSFEAQLRAQEVATATAAAKQASALARLEAELAVATARGEDLEAELTLRTTELRQREMALMDLEASVHRLRSEFQQRENQLQKELAVAISQRRDARAELDGARLEAAESIAQASVATDAALQEARARQAAEATATARWAIERRELEASHALAMDSLRADLEARLKSGREEAEARLAELRRKGKNERAALQQQLEEERCALEAAREEAVAEALRRGTEQQRRVSSAFRAARSLCERREAELKEAYDQLEKKLSTRESREDDLRVITGQAARLADQAKEIERMGDDVEALRRELHNRDVNDRIFSEAELRRRRTASARSRSGSVGLTEPSGTHMQRGCGVMPPLPVPVPLGGRERPQLVAACPLAAAPAAQYRTRTSSAGRSRCGDAGACNVRGRDLSEPPLHAAFSAGAAGRAILQISSSPSAPSCGPAVRNNGVVEPIFVR